MRCCNEQSFRSQFDFLKRQLLQNGGLPLTDILSRETVEQALDTIGVAWNEREGTATTVDPLQRDSTNARSISGDDRDARPTPFDDASDCTKGYQEPTHRGPAIRRSCEAQAVR